MSLLQDRPWKTRYDSDSGRLVQEFFEPALDCAVRYDRTTGYFAARALTIAARGIEGLVRNRGRMRLVVGCTLEQSEVDAIQRGQRLRDAIETHLMATPLAPGQQAETEALELLAWMVANSYLDVKVAVPCDRQRRPVAGTAIFHAKSGIIEDKTGDRLAFIGSVNETEAGWLHNSESFHVFTNYDSESDKKHLDEEDGSFARLWADQREQCMVLSVPAAVQANLLRFLPTERPPSRLAAEELVAPEPDLVPPVVPEPAALTSALMPADDLRRLVWGIIRHGPALRGAGERVGEATANVTPWPHQVRAFQRLYDSWPPRLLIADEVGLGKTIEAGLLLRQALLAGRARRILILAPRAVLSQWQIELREKFNLNWPIYDGQRLRWLPSPALDGAAERPTSRNEWHREPCVIASSQLMRRLDRAPELLESAEPWDLVMLDEAHHARRRGVFGPRARGPNHLLRLMQGLVGKTQGLVMLTATPMQVDPVEVWDLLHLLGLPEAWTADAFRNFFQLAARPNPSHEEFEQMAALFRTSETRYGPTSEDEAQRAWSGGSVLAVRKVLAALRDDAQTGRRMLNAERRVAAVRIMRASTPVARLVSRHTRDLLRRYYRAGRITTRIPDRNVHDEFVELSPEERRMYGRMEDYISSTYNAANPEVRSAVGFVMTIYRRRLASCFAALEKTLSARLASLRGRPTLVRDWDEDASEDDVDEEFDDEQLTEMEREALRGEERADLEELIGQVQQLPTDTKAKALLQQLKQLKSDGYTQVMVFTQYTDTLDFLRELVRHDGHRVLCFSGRGGEVPMQSGGWRRISRDDVKRIFRDTEAEIMLCTDAAAEGLNFQFCGALINYDMPWNPMRVEQRIGRIDRLGQRYESIRIINLHYKDSVETDVYVALRERIGLFTTFVGKLQPILSTLPSHLRVVALAAGEERAQKRDEIIRTLTGEIENAERSPFDLDDAAAGELDDPQRPAPLYDLATLRTLLERSDLLPPGSQAKPLDHGTYEWSAPGMDRGVRVTARANFYEQHPGSCELFSPGNPLFPEYEAAASFDEIAARAAELPTILAVLTEHARSVPVAGR